MKCILILFLFIVCFGFQIAVMACGCGCSNANNCGAATTPPVKKTEAQVLYCQGSQYKLAACEQKEKDGYIKTPISSCCGSCTNGGTKK